MSQTTLDAYDGAFGERDGRVHHPLVRAGAMDARPYQVRLAALAVEASLLVVLPTGLGKTNVALLASAELLRTHADAQVVIVAPTRPLVDQHARSFRDALALPRGDVVALTGHVPPARRAEMFDGARVVVSTPHALANDVAAGRVRLTRVALFVMDEAHRCTGEYPYVPLARAYRAGRAGARILALTASPGARRDRIEAVLDTLGRPRVEAREKEDEDVRAFVQETVVAFQRVRLPDPARGARDELARLLAERLRKLRPFIPRRNVEDRVGRGALLETGEVIRKRLLAARGMSQRGFCFAALQNHAVAMHALHAVELIETQGLHTFRAFVDRIGVDDAPSKAQSAFLKDARVQRALQLARASEVSHPKENALMHALGEQLAEKPESLVLVFAQYRDTVRVLLERLRRAGYDAARFVGQASKGEGDEGMSQDDQARLLRRFANGGVRILIATSVAEEGLHVPDVDLVVFYEPVPSEIRTIQRRGRTGRNRAGRVLVLVTEESRDEVYVQVEAEREAEMRRVVGQMREAGRA